MPKWFSTVVLIVLVCSSVLTVASDSSRQQNASYDEIGVMHFSNLLTAICSLEVDAKVLSIGTRVNRESLMIPAVLQVKIVNGDSIGISSGSRLEIARRFEADKHPVYSGSGKVQLDEGNVTVVYPEWFGAKADGLTDSTVAIQKAIEAVKNGTVYLSPGVYIISDSLKLLNKADVIIMGKGSTIKQVTSSKEMIHVSGCTNITFKDLILYGVLENAGPIGTENSIRVDPNLNGTSGENRKILIENITFMHNGLNAIYLGGDRSRYGRLSDVRITNCKMEYGLSFMLAVGVKQLTVDSIEIVHRNSPPVGSGISQDEDIAVISAHGVSCENVKITNISIDAKGSVQNHYTGRPKLDFMIAEAGLSFKNLVVDTVHVINNLGNFKPTYGTNGSSMYISDRSSDKNGFVNARFSNITIKNSPGIFIEANNLRFDKIFLSGFPPDTGWNLYGRAIDSASKVSTRGCVFTNIVIDNWASSPTIYTAEGGVMFSNLHITNSKGAVWAASDSIYDNITLENISDSVNGAFWVGFNTKNIVVNRAILRNNRYVALKVNDRNPHKDNVFLNISYENNKIDSNIPIKYLNNTGKGGYNNSHRMIGKRHFWVDTLGRLRISHKATATDSDGRLFESSN